MKIAVFGDSFGVYDPTESNSWVALLRQRFTIMNYCQRGISEYKVLQQIKNSNLDQFDYIIITHTSPTRIFVRNNPLHANDKMYSHCDVIYADVENRNDDFSTACKQYFKHIFDVDYALDVHNMICREINTLCQARKVLHMTHFDYSNCYQFDNMLNFYSHWLDNRGRINHYNLSGNQYVYQTVLERINHDLQVN